MAKILNRAETQEIINLMLEEVGCRTGILRFVEATAYHKAFWGYYDQVEKQIKFFKWKKTWKKFAARPWWAADTQEDLVIKIEKWIEDELTERIEKAENVRRRHSTRLLDKEMRK